MNMPSGESSSWLSAYQAAVEGQFIATPYHDVKVTDPVKLANASAAFQEFKAGQISTLPNIQDVFLDYGLRDMGFAPKKGLDGRGMLVQMCQECHNTNLDMSLSRERFRMDDFDRMSRKERDLAIQRLQLSAETRFRMPPPLFRTITDDERNLMIDELKKEPTKR